jgi:hypothetical protein
LSTETERVEGERLDRHSDRQQRQQSTHLRGGIEPSKRMRNAITGARPHTTRSARYFMNKKKLQNNDSPYPGSREPSQNPFTN